MSERSTLHVDCDSCSARGPACGDCVVSVLLGVPGPRVELDTDEQQALSALASSGLVPPLRLVPRTRPVRSVAPPLHVGWDDVVEDDETKTGEGPINTWYVTGSEG